MIAEELNQLKTQLRYTLDMFIGRSAKNIGRMVSADETDVDYLFRMMCQYQHVSSRIHYHNYGFVVNDTEDADGSRNKRIKRMLSSIENIYTVLGIFKKEGENVVFRGYSILNEFITTNVVTTSSGYSTLNVAIRAGLDETGWLRIDEVISKFDIVADIGLMLQQKGKVDKSLFQQLHSRKWTANTGDNVSVSRSNEGYRTKKELSEEEKAIQVKIRKIYSENKDKYDIIYKMINNKDPNVIGMLEAMDEQPEALNMLGRIYQKGELTAKNPKKSEMYYLKALEIYGPYTDKRTTQIRNSIGDLYYQQYHDYESAKKWYTIDGTTKSIVYYRKADCCYRTEEYQQAFDLALRCVELDYRAGYFILGKIVEFEDTSESVGIEKNEELAARCFEECIRLKNKNDYMGSRAKKGLAKMLVSGQIDYKDHPQALASLVDLANKRDIEMAAELGKAFYNGRFGFDIDLKKAEYYFDIGINDRLTKASNCFLSYAEMISLGLTKHEKSFAVTVLNWCYANNPKNVSVRHMLGVFKYHGIGCEQDYEAAYRYFMESLEMNENDTVALAHIAMMKITGTIVDRDLTEGTRILEQLIDSDYGSMDTKVYAHFMTATRFFYGIETDVDYQKALSSFTRVMSYGRRSAFLNVHSKAIECVRKLYGDDDIRIIEISQDSLLTTDSAAQEIAGDFLLRENDYVSAFAYYERAVSNGSISSKDKMDLILKSHPDLIKESDEEDLLSLKIRELNKEKMISETRGHSAENCKLLIDYLSGEKSLEDIDEQYMAIIQDESST